MARGDLFCELKYRGGVALQMGVLGAGVAGPGDTALAGRIKWIEVACKFHCLMK